MITQDTTLDTDLIDCPGDGIVIGAAGITLDLNGRTVDGDGDPRRYAGCDTGIVNGRFTCQDPQTGYDGVTIRGGTVREFAFGIQVVEASRNALLHLRLYEHTGFGGIATYLMSDGRIEHNRAFGNDGAGIAVYEPTGRMTISGNVLGRNSVWGIELAGSAAGDRLEGNVAFENAGGFFLFGTRGLLVRGNRSFGNGGTGMLLADGSIGNRVEGNSVWANGFTGIQLEEGSHENGLEGNNVYRNARAALDLQHAGGITVGEGDDNQIVGNRVVENGGHGGIVLGREGASNDVVANFVSGSARHGIAVGTLYEDAGGMTITGNRSLRNGVDGIHVRQELLDPEPHIQVATVSRNRTDRNGDDGIDVDTGTVLLSANRAMKNLDLGIEAVPGVWDGGGNVAFHNGNPLECLNVSCRRYPSFATDR